MIHRKPEGNNPLKSCAFLIGVEYEEGEVTQEQMANRLSDALSWVEGVSTVDVESLGEIQTYEDDGYGEPKGSA